jgi:hypothetical protein
MSKRRPSAKKKANDAKTVLRKVTKEKWRLQKLKPLEVSLREHLGKMLDNTSIMDLAKLATIIGITPIIKTIIDTSEDLRSELDYFISGGILTGKKWAEFREQKIEGFFPDWADWVFSFAIAYLIVENFGSIMHATGDILSSVKNMVTGLLIGSPMIA